MSAVDDKLMSVLDVSWAVAIPGFKFHDWQKELLRRMFELYPEGHVKAGTLRFREYAVSVSRQVGKTELIAAATIANLLWRDDGGAPGAGTYTIGVASTAEQARLVHTRVLKIINANPALARRMSKMTDTRGIATKKGNIYELRANRPGIIQGLDLATAIVDETHLGSPEVYASLQSGLGARDSAILLSITTAGDENSELLKGLYERGMESLDDPKTRFGFCCWEASSTDIPEDTPEGDIQLLKLLREANPSLAEGHIDESNLLTDVRATPARDVIRYRLNRFTASVSEFIPAEDWKKCQRPFGSEFPRDAKSLVFAIDKSVDWGFASIVVCGKDDAGIIHTELVRSIKKPTAARLIDECLALTKWGPAAFVVDSQSLRDLGNELQARGLPVKISGYQDIISGSSYFYELVKSRRISHAGEFLIQAQLQRTKTKSAGDGWKITRKDSSMEIDAIIATVIGVTACSNINQQELQIY